MKTDSQRHAAEAVHTQCCMGVVSLAGFRLAGAGYFFFATIGLLSIWRLPADLVPLRDPVFGVSMTWVTGVMCGLGIVSGVVCVFLPGRDDFHVVPDGGVGKRSNSNLGRRGNRPCLVWLAGFPALVWLVARLCAPLLGLKAGFAGYLTLFGAAMGMSGAAADVVLWVASGVANLFLICEFRFLIGPTEH